MSWIAFNLFVLLMLALDLGVFHKNAHEVKAKEALIWSGVWITLALIFCIGVYHFQGPESALEFLTGYLIEKSLSVDNIFIFLLIFTYFKTPPAQQHRVLFWGVLGALIMRAIFIFAGVALIQKFHGIIYVFGAFLIFSGYKMFRQKTPELNPEKNPLLKLFMSRMRVNMDPSNAAHGDFFTIRDGKRYATSLFVCLVFVEVSDLIFAVDSIPAILAITPDPFIVYTSNVFAILGLRSLYFALARFAELFEYLHYGLAAILVFVGCKMLLSAHYKIPAVAALGVILGILTLSIWLSIRKKKQ